MSRRVLAVMLVVSLVFNLAVLLGFLRSRATRPTAPQTGTTLPDERSMLARLSRELTLDGPQLESVRALQQRQQQQASVFNDSLVVLRQDLQQELRKPDPDLEHVRTLVDQEADLHRQRRQADAELYGEFVGLLTADQKQRLSDRMGRRDASPGGQGRQPAGGAGTGGAGGPMPSPEAVRRYDRDNDGRLNTEEARRARSDLQNRRREVAPHVQQLPPLWPWFDADDDGMLNAAERADMQKFLSEHRPPRMGPDQMPQSPQDGRRAPDRRGGAPNRGARPPQGGDAPNNGA